MQWDFFRDHYIFFLTLLNPIQTLNQILLSYLKYFVFIQNNYVLKFHLVYVLLFKNRAKIQILQDQIQLKEFLYFLMQDFFLNLFVYLNPSQIFFLGYLCHFLNLSIYCFFIYLFYVQIQFINLLKVFLFVEFLS